MSIPSHARRVARTLVLLALGALASATLASCGNDATAPTETLVFATTSTTYTRPASGTATVAFTVDNTGNQSRSVVACGPMLTPRIERLQDASWTSYGGGICQAIYVVVPAPIPAGAKRTGEVTVDQAGRYRLVLDTEGNGRLTSNTFDVN